MTRKTVLESVTGLLPAKAQPYAKTLAATLMAVLTILPVVTEAPDWITVAVAILSAPVVFALPNLDPLAQKQDESVQPPGP
jgi:hypothetical protein